MSDGSDSEDRDILFRNQVDPDEPYSIAVHVAKAVASASGQELSELDPLYSYVDGEALGQLIDSGSYIYVTFDYEGFEVEIRGRESVEIIVHST